MKRRTVLSAAVLAGLAGLPGTAAPAMNVGDVVPDFVREDLDGRTVQLSRLRGRLLLLNFWASWCPPCREEMPVFSAWQKELGAAGLQVIGVAMDDDRSEVTGFLARFPVSYPIVMGDAKFARQLGGVLGLPLTYLVDAQGRVVARFQGEADLSRMEATIRKFLDQ
jgi:thiol-disulfide isomerase/thioredoxin|nr:MAG: redoxin [Pseudomonadota bacterium]